MPPSLTPRQERPILWLIAAVQLTLILDFMIMMPLGPELMQRLDISAAQFGAMVSAYTLASGVVGLLGTLWLDRFDRKRTLVALYGGFIAATISCGAAMVPAWLLISRALAGACAGLLWAVLMAVVVDLVPVERRGRALGTVMASHGLAAVVGVPLGLSLASQWGWRAPFWAMGGLAIVLWIGAMRLLPPMNRHLTAPPSEPEEARAPSAPLFTPSLALGWGLTFCVVFSGFLLIPYLSAFMVGNLGLRQSDLPWVYLCGGAAALLTSRLIGHLVDRHSPARVLACLLLGTMVPHLWFTHLTPSPLPAVIGVFVLFMTLTSGRIIPTIALITSRVPPALRGRFMAVNTATSDGASGLAAWTSGLLITSSSEGALIGFDKMGWMAVGVTLVALSVLWLLGRTAAQESAAAT